MAEYTGVPDTPISPSGTNIWGLPTSIPQALPEIPKLPALPPIGPDTAAPFPGTETIKAIGSAFSILTDPGRVITVAVGLLFIFGAMYLLGTGQIENAIRKAVK